MQSSCNPRDRAQKVAIVDFLIRLEVGMKRRGPNLVCSEGCEQYTGQPTIPNRREKPFFHHNLLEKNGGDDGTRTRGLCRDRAAF